MVMPPGVATGGMPRSDDHNVPRAYSAETRRRLGSGHARTPHGSRHQPQHLGRAGDGRLRRHPGPLHRGWRAGREPDPAGRTGRVQPPAAAAFNPGGQHDEQQYQQLVQAFDPDTTHGQITGTMTITTVRNDLTELARTLPAGSAYTDRPRSGPSASWLTIPASAFALRRPGQVERVSVTVRPTFRDALVPPPVRDRPWPPALAGTLGDEIYRRKGSSTRAVSRA